MKRIFGVETEFGLAYTQRQTRRLGPEELARHMFRKVVEWGRSSNVFLPNGARLYLDVGSHPEYATAECDSLADLLAQDRAGEGILLELLADAQAAIEAEGHDGTVHLLKNNADSSGNSYGCHENYLIRRTVEFSRLTTALLPFLVSRQLLVGAGALIGAVPPGTRAGEGPATATSGTVFGFSARSDFMWEGVSSATTRSRPIINARDEPHADAALYRRLHVIVGDSNRSETTSLLKLGSAGLVIDLIESGRPLKPFTLKDPIADIRLLARDLGSEHRMRLADGGETTAADMLEYFLGEAADLVARGDHSLGDDALAVRVIDLWQRTLTAVRTGDWDPVATEIDWAIKRRLFARYQQRLGLDPGDFGDPRLTRLDLAYHDLTPGAGIFGGLEEAGLAARLTERATVARAADVPPQTTRARLRGEFIRRAHEQQLDFTVDWVHLRLNDRAQRAVVCKDPFQSEDERVDRLLALMSDA